MYKYTFTNLDIPTSIETYISRSIILSYKNIFMCISKHIFFFIKIRKCTRKVIYSCSFTYVNKFIYSHSRIYIHIYTNIHVYIYIYLHKNIHLFPQYKNGYERKFAFIYTCSYTNILIYTYKHSNIYI